MSAPPPLRLLSSMATRHWLAQELAEFTRVAGVPVALEATGGVEAARRVREGEAVDLIVLAADALERLQQAGRLAEGPLQALVVSPVAVAVPASAPELPMREADDLQRLLRASRRVAFSTGPSGAHVLRLLAGWGLDGPGGPQPVQAPPGVPVGQLVAQGQADVGLQQLSELQGLPGLRLLGTLPADVACDTVFAGAVGAQCASPQAARALLAHLASPARDASRLQHGLRTPAPASADLPADPSTAPAP